MLNLKLLLDLSLKVSIKTKHFFFSVLTSSTLLLTGFTVYSPLGSDSNDKILSRMKLRNGISIFQVLLCTFFFFSSVNNYSPLRTGNKNVHKVARSKSFNPLSLLTLLRLCVLCFFSLSVCVSNARTAEFPEGWGDRHYFHTYHAISHSLCVKYGLS